MVQNSEATFQTFMNSLFEGYIVKALELAASDYELRQSVRAYQIIKKLRSFVHLRFPEASQQSKYYPGRL